MAGKSTDRKGKSKEPKPGTNELAENLATFTLPVSLPCSEVDFPILIKRKTGANWQEILEESNQRLEEIEAFSASKQEQLPKSPFLKLPRNGREKQSIQLGDKSVFGTGELKSLATLRGLRHDFITALKNTECDYIKNEVFEHLIPALEETLNKAKVWEALSRQKCFFNGIDHIVQVLWNNNPRYPGRKDQNTHLFNMPWVRAYLKENPRPYYPKSWLWPEHYAATLIQKTVRQYFVQRDDEVQEMRDFWRKLEVERTVTDMETNPYLAKKFASTQNFRN